MEKLFYKDIHIVDFEATVTDCSQEADGRYRITLDQTAFFPEEGGQGADKGTLSGMEVLDVQIKKDVIEFLSLPILGVWRHLDFDLSLGSRCIKYFKRRFSRYETGSKTGNYCKVQIT